MAKTTKSTKKPTRKASSKLPTALKENMVIASADLDAHLKQMTEKLNALGISADTGSIVLAGRFSNGSRWVQVNISTGEFARLGRNGPLPSQRRRCTSIRRCSSSTITSRSAPTCSRRSVRTPRLKSN